MRSSQPHGQEQIFFFSFFWIIFKGFPSHQLFCKTFLYRTLGECGWQIETFLYIFCNLHDCGMEIGESDGSRRRGEKIRHFYFYLKENWNLGRWGWDSQLAFARMFLWNITKHRRGRGSRLVNLSSSGSARRRRIQERAGSSPGHETSAPEIWLVPDLGLVFCGVFK